MNPKSRSVFLIETLLTPRIIIQLISDVLFRIYEVYIIYYILYNVGTNYLLLIGQYSSTIPNRTREWPHT